jgi:hypothetical protein
VIIGVVGVDLDGVDRVGGGEFNALTSGTVLNLMRHTSDAKFATRSGRSQKSGKCMPKHSPTDP